MNNQLFKPGKLTFVMDGQFGSSGKGKITSFIGQKYRGEWQFACNAFSAQAGHWVRLNDGRCYFYQHLNSVAYDHSAFEKLYIGPSSCIELPALLREIEENKIPVEKLGIDPKATIILKRDMDFERGLCGFDGEGAPDEMGTARFGSTAHGVGSATARKVLRRPSVALARNEPALAPYLCDVSREILNRLACGQSGILEVAQGFPLSLNGDFYPYCTSRNVTTSQALSDMFLPPRVAGPVVINLRTLPIRINSRKFVCLEDGRHLTWEEVKKGIPHKVIEGNSGPWYPDQKEITWEEVTYSSGSPTMIMEMTSVTKLPRRIASFSLKNVVDAIDLNDTGHGTHLSVNFANYIDHDISGKSSTMTDKFIDWAMDNLKHLVPLVKFVGTGPKTHETIVIESLKDWF